MADGEFNGTDGENYVIVGGAGTDTVSLELVDGEAFDVTDLNITFSGIEAIKIEGDAEAGEGEVGDGDVIFSAAALDGLTLAISGNSTGDQQMRAQARERTQARHQEFESCPRTSRAATTSKRGRMHRRSEAACDVVPVQRKTL
jgi:hypothetical protein